MENENILKKYRLKEKPKKHKEYTNGLIKLSKPTIIKLNWIKDNFDNYQYEEDLIQAMKNKFDICEKHIKRYLNFIYGKDKFFCQGEKTRTKKIKENTTQPTYLNENECYFCKDKINLVKHHYCYNPEKLVFVCKSCHSKIHNIL